MTQQSRPDRDGHRLRILDAAEAVLRRHGPEKLTVVDVARALDQSHASVYRHFAGKADLLDALVGRWLEAIMSPLRAIAQAEGPAADRFRSWLLALHRAKLRKVTTDPEHFAMYHALAHESAGAVSRHLSELADSLGSIVEAGSTSGEFRVSDPRRAARAALNATSRFHHPAMLSSREVAATEEDLGPVIDLLLAGLRAGVV